MDPFLLFSLNPFLLEKVINKFEVKSYCRFQQTCRSSYLFIQDSQNICVHCDGIFLFDEKKFVNLCTIAETDIEGLHKTRLRNFLFPEFDSPRDFNTFCQAVKSHRITCTELRISFPTYIGRFDLVTVEECARLIDILQPVAIYLDSVEFSEYKAILTSKMVKFVELRLYQREVDLVVPQLLSFEKVVIHASDRSFDNDTYATLRGVLQVLFSQTRPKLREFVYEIEWASEQPPSEKELEEKLSDYGLKIEHRDGKSRFGAVKLPDYFPIESCCHVNLYSCHVNLYNNCFFELKYSRGEE